MANEFSVTKATDRAVVVVLQSGCEISRDEILAFLREAGVDTSNVTFVEPHQVAECDDFAGASVIIPVDEKTCDLPELADAGRYCGTAGGHVVVVFGPGFAFEGLHPIADKYGTQCGWSPDQLKGCMPGKADAPRNTSGVRKKRSSASQVDC